MKTNSYSIKVETITPDLAKEFLGTSLRNRTINQRRVDMYAQEMIHGKWSPATLLIMDSDGHLVDAHHRLNAVIKAGVAVDMVVFRGLEKRFIPSIDTGRPRSAGDMLAFIEGLDDMKSLRNKAALVRNVLIVRSGMLASMPAHDEIANFMIANRNIVDECYTDFCKIRALGVTIGVGAAIFLIREANGNHAAKIAEFVDQIATGEMLTSKMPTYALRSALFNNNRSSGGRRIRGDMYFVLKAWRAFVHNEEIKILRRPKVFENEDFGAAVISGED